VAARVQRYRGRVDAGNHVGTGNAAISTLAP
jgi:hypothetical protein